MSPALSLGWKVQAPLMAPKQVPGLADSITAVGPGQHHTLFLTQGGKLLSAGRPTYGRSGQLPGASPMPPSYWQACWGGLNIWGAQCCSYSIDGCISMVAATCCTCSTELHMCWYGKVTVRNDCTAGWGSREWMQPQTALHQCQAKCTSRAPASRAQLWPPLWQVLLLNPAKKCA